MTPTSATVISVASSHTLPSSSPRSSRPPLRLSPHRPAAPKPVVHLPQSFLSQEAQLLTTAARASLPSPLSPWSSCSLPWGLFLLSILVCCVWEALSFLNCASVLFSNIEIVGFFSPDYRNKLCSVYKIQTVQKGLKRKWKSPRVNDLVVSFVSFWIFHMCIYMCVCEYVSCMYFSCF